MSEKISEESVPVQELKTPAMISVRRFLRSVMVVLLAFLCVFVGMLIYQLHTPIDKIQPMPPIKKKTPEVAVFVPKIEQSEKLPVSDVPEQKPDEMPVAKAESVYTVKASVSNLSPVVAKMSEPITLSSEPEYRLPVLSLADALRLRDRLATGGECSDSLQKIIKSQVPSPADRDNLIDRLLPVCMAHHPFQEMEKVFKSDKKQALFTYYRLHNPAWLAYLKAVGTALVDIRRIHPVKQRAKDVISLAQNALILHDVSQTLTYIRKLPSEIQADFAEFTQLAEAYLSAQQAAEELVLSFEKGK